MLYSCAGRRRALPVAVVREIGQACAAAPVPFAKAGFEGLVDLDGLLTAQFDLSEAMGGGARSGRYSILVDTASGPLRLRVDGASLADSVAGDAMAPGLPEIEALIAALAPSEPELVLQPNVADGSAEKPFEVLIVRSGGTPVALLAAEVERVERHQGVRASRRGNADECIVVVDGEILSGWSLAARLDPELGSGAEDESWVVVIRCDGRRAALTVAEVHGVMAVPFRHARLIRHRDGTSLWLPGPGHGPDTGMIEVIGAAEFGETGFQALLPEDITPDDALPADMEERRSADRGRLAVGLGPFSCVVPESLIVEVLGEAGLERLAARRGRGTIPLLDPAPLLGLSASDAVARRVLVLRRSKGRTLALRVAGIAPAALGPAWQPLPMLPSSAHRLFQSVRIVGGACEFLLRESAFDRPRDPVIVGLLRTARTGWLSGY